VALYRFIELAEHVLRTVPREEREIILAGYTRKDGPSPHTVVLQRGNYVGDIWWETPDGDTIFNHFRIAHDNSPPGVLSFSAFEKGEFDNSEKANDHTAQYLGILFTNWNRVVVAGTRGCATSEGPSFIKAFESTQDKTLDAFPANDDPQNMLMEVPVTAEERKSIYGIRQAPCHD
jgi:hypothetical protein